MPTVMPCCRLVINCGIEFCFGDMYSQVLYFLEPVRCSLRNHICSREFCLSCELNILFRMLDQCRGENCQASNFLRTFRTLREALALGLVMSDLKCQADFRKIIQQWTSFVLQQLHQVCLSVCMSFTDVLAFSYVVMVICKVIISLYVTRPVKINCMSTKQSSFSIFALS